jgi:3-hydroxyisobutyrate dehydrogenase-like beta-hydroxyacid dehydrogenase
MDIGFIGLGQMGFHMARRLVEAGHRLVVFDNRREAIEPLTALGAQAAASPRELADAVETVMVSLPTPDVVLAVATGASGVIEGKRVAASSICRPPAQSWPSASSRRSRRGISCRSTAP